MAVSHLKCPFATQIPPAMAMMTISRCPPRSVRSTPPPKGRIGLQGVSQREILTICWRIWHYTNGNTHNGNAIIGWHPNMLEILHVWYIYQQNWVILDRGKCWDSYSSTMVRIWEYVGDSHKSQSNMGNPSYDSYNSWMAHWKNGVGTYPKINHQT